MPATSGSTPAIATTARRIFAYFEDTAQWYEDAEVKHRVLDSSHGVTVEKVEPLVYRVSYQGKSVMFALNDLRGVKPPAGALGPDEIFSGRSSTSPRSASFCVFNRKLKIFHYVLDETGTVPDQFFSPHEARPHPGRQAHRLCVLPGSSAEPEDPDRRVRGQHARQQLFRRAVRPASRQFHRGRDACATRSSRVRPQLKGEIDRFGASPDGSIRFMIGPYLPYSDVRDLDPIHACAVKKQKQPDYYRCFVTGRRIRWYGGAEARSKSGAARQ